LVSGEQEDPRGRNLGFVRPEKLDQAEFNRALRRMQTENLGIRRIEFVYRALQHLPFVIDEAVSLARSQGATWEEIGRAFGDVSKQATQGRFKHLD
jgi:hypothetical protein